ncbi:MAG: hypothetical protein EON59_13780 [Alphaproteobacteria bacterium]|nr:MAG: hypothetical protein EON59_13780 [Alphaproteobacteria bacterium]
MAGVATALLMAMLVPGDTPPKTCALTQAAYGLFIGASAPAYPSKIRVARRPLHRLTESTPQYREKMALRPGEFHDLASRQAATIEGYVPVCVWDGPFTDPPGDERAFTAFSAPIVSSDGKLALVECRMATTSRHMPSFASCAAVRGSGPGNASPRGVPADRIAAVGSI